jgi:hypothetical protein
VNNFVGAQISGHLLKIGEQTADESGGVDLRAELGVVVASILPAGAKFI